jgi:CIC family chloride channel protein
MTDDGPQLATPELKPLRPAVDPGRTGAFTALRNPSVVSRVFVRLGLILGRKMALVVRDDHVYLLILAALVGVVSGLSAGGLLRWIEVAEKLFPHPHSGPWFAFVAICVPALGGLLAGLIRFVGERKGNHLHEGVPAVVEAVVNKHGYLRGRDAGFVGAGTGVTIGSGGAVGHEGPIVFIGAAMGSVVARFLGLHRRRQVVMVGAGCAAGLAAAFNAPLAGVIFTIEVVFGRSAGGNIGTMSVFAPLIVAAVTGTFVSHAVFGARTEFDAGGQGLISASEMVPYLVMAVVCGLLGPLLSSALTVSARLFDKLPVARILKPALGGLLVGVMAWAFTRQVLFSGREMVHASFEGSFVWWTAGVTAVLKILATSLTLGSGAFGGFFMPSLGIGAAIGAFIHGLIAYPLLGSAAGSVSAYALVGMGGFLGSVLRAPLTPIVMIFELTHNYGLILPLMTTCILSSFVASRIQPDSVFHRALKQRGIIHEPQQAEQEVMKRGRVGELMRRGEGTIPENTTLEALRPYLDGSDALLRIVVDESGRPLGTIDARFVAERLLRGDCAGTTNVGECCRRTNLHLLRAEDSLAGALWAFASAGSEILPVVDGSQQLIATLHRSDIFSRYINDVLRHQEESVHVHTESRAVSHELGLGAGVILEQVVVGRAWAGKSLAQLDLRGRAQVQVLEWVREAKTIRIDPHAPLQAGDSLTVAGTRDGILEMRRLT